MGNTRITDVVVVDFIRGTLTLRVIRSRHELLSKYGITPITTELLGYSRITGITAELRSNTGITELLTRNMNDPVLAITLVSYMKINRQ